MDEKQLKTSPLQRVVILIIAILLVGSTVLTYLFIVMNNSNGRQSQTETITELESQLDAKREEIQTVGRPLVAKYFDDMKSYKNNRVKSYNSTTANNEKLKTEDIKVGTGRELDEGDTDYSALYIGWCADGSIFDSSFDYAEDDTDMLTPTELKAPMIASTGLIEGWNQGIIGMRIGGVRQINIPTELAYGDTRDDICGGANAPLRFIVMALETDDELKKLNDEFSEIYAKYYTALIGGSI